MLIYKTSENKYFPHDNKTLYIKENEAMYIIISLLFIAPSIIFKLPYIRNYTDRYKDHNSGGYFRSPTLKHLSPQLHSFHPYLLTHLLTYILSYFLAYLFDHCSHNDLLGIWRAATRFLKRIIRTLSLGIAFISLI
jgi:hypothetical protein